MITLWVVLAIAKPFPPAKDQDRFRTETMTQRTFDTEDECKAWLKASLLGPYAQCYAVTLR